MKNWIISVLIILACTGCASMKNTANNMENHVRNVLAGSYECVYEGGVKPVLILTSDGTFSITINRCEFMVTREGRYVLKGQMLICSADPWFGDKKGKHDIVFSCFLTTVSDCRVEPTESRKTECMDSALPVMEICF